MALGNTLSIDAMGGDDAPRVVIDGLAAFSEQRADVLFQLHGDEARLKPMLDDAPSLAKRCEIVHTDISVDMAEKPSQALKKARGSSMWNAIESVRAGDAQSAISAGNTGALMAMSMLALRKMKGVHRPGMTALWPTITGTSVILDVGANLEADASQLVTFAIMGEAYARAIFGVERPTVGLLNIGSEEMKGHEEIRAAAAILADNSLDLNYQGFVEGDDISKGVVDVVVTDGFTGNVAIKTAEGTARMFAHFMKAAFGSGPAAMTGALLARPGLKTLRTKLNPARANGAVLLGLNGLVVKSHGGTDAEGYANALRVAADLANSHYVEEVAASLSKIGSARAA